MKILFREEQKFTQWWLWLILISIAILPFIELYQQLVGLGKFETKPSSVLGIILYSVFVFGIIALFWFMRLKTEIDQKEIRMNFFPFTKKQVLWRDIKSAKIVNYGFVGGWGIRFGSKYGTVYNASGNKGLALELFDGENFVIGTQKQDELKRLIEEMTNVQKGN